MNSFKRIKERHAAKVAAKQESELALAEARKQELVIKTEKMRALFTEVRDELAKMGIVCSERSCVDDNRTEATTYGTNLSGQVFKINIYIRGGFSIKKL